MRLFLSTVFVAMLLAGCQGKPQATDAVTQRFIEVQEQMEHVVETQGARVALEQFALLINEPLVAGVCHGIAHEIGRAAYEKHGFEDALLAESDICGSGYLHGVIETHFSTIDDPVAAAHSICAPESANCFHGLGHGMMFSMANDLPRSLELCRTFDEGFQRIQCAEGVFMENFNTDVNSHPSRFLREDDPFFPCREPEEPYKGVCAFYAPRYYIQQHPGEYIGALRWCTTVGDGPDDGCAKGVGSVAMKQNIQRPEFVEAVCATGEGDQIGYCVEGMVSYYIVHYASAKKGQELCGILQSGNQARCAKIVRESERFYGE